MTETARGKLQQRVSRSDASDLRLEIWAWLSTSRYYADSMLLMLFLVGNNGRRLGQPDPGVSQNTWTWKDFFQNATATQTISQEYQEGDVSLNKRTLAQGARSRFWCALASHGAA